MADLESALGYSFEDHGLVRLALTHRSREAEDVSEESNERLEFLGDAVLGLVIADLLLSSGGLAEGAMAKVRASVVDEGTLAAVAGELGLGTHLRLGRGEEASGGRAKPSILADTLEAVIGAIYLDGGIEAARRFIVTRWERRVAERATAPGLLDYKTRLQEILARRGQVPQYRVTGSGPDHSRRFTAEVLVSETVVGTGAGTSKKRAEQEAAREAVIGLGEIDA